MVRITAGFDGGRGPAHFVASAEAALARATRDAVSIAANGLKTELRAEILSAGLGSRLGNGIGSKVYPSGGQGSLDAAAIVFPRGKSAERIFDSFNTGAVIRGKSGNWLAIPTRNAYLGGRGGHRPTPAEFEQQTGIKLRVAAPKNSSKGKYQFLVGESVAGRKSGRKAVTSRRTAAGRQSITLVFFILIREAHMRRRLSFEAKAKVWAERIPGFIDTVMGVGQ